MLLGESFCEDRRGQAPPPHVLRLPLSCAACQFLYFALLGATWIVARLERFFRGALFTGGALGLLAVFFA